MDEADRLCNRIAIVDHGKLVALDTPDALKASIPGRSAAETTLDDVFVHYTGGGCATHCRRRRRWTVRS